MREEVVSNQECVQSLALPKVYRIGFQTVKKKKQIFANNSSASLVRANPATDRRLRGSG
jgi:hypothetical protein